MNDWVTIRTIKNKNPDMSNREIAGIMKMSHNTVKSALQSDEPPCYKREPAINEHIKPFAELIEEQFLAKGFRRSRILANIISKGYKGSQSAFYRFMEKIQATNKKAFMPYNTAPGEQAQFDWSEYSVVINDINTKVYVFTYILGFSRFRIFEASLTQTQASIFDALENSILETKGVTQRVQTDNAKSFINKTTRGNPEWNPRYLHFCGHYRFEPSRSLPRHPWSKGKVEKPFQFLEDHFIKGNEFDSFDDFYNKLKLFQSDVNNKIHSSTQQKPSDLYLQEIESLAPLPKHRFVSIKEEVRKVTADCLISFQGNRYSVPYLFATKEVWLKVSKGTKLMIYSSQNNLIAEHNLSLQKGEVIIIKEHYKNYRIEKGNWKRLSQSFLQIFPEHNWFLDKLKTQKKINPDYHLTRILDIASFYRADDIRNAFDACSKFNVYNYLFIKGYLENHCKIEEIKPIPIHQNILNSIEKVEIIRPLNESKIAYLEQLE